MTRVFKTDAVILGAGLAGLCIADALMERGLNCTVLERGAKPGSGASGAPMLLANPAAGRRAKMSWESEKCISHLGRLLLKISQKGKTPNYITNGVIRPALTPQIADDFSRSPQKYDWPKNWIEWIPPEPFNKKYPFFVENYGGLFIKEAITADGKGICNDLAEWITASGSQILFGVRPVLEYKSLNAEWVVQLKDRNENIHTPVVVDATGYSQTGHPFWDFLPLHPIKGQTITCALNEPLQMESSVSSLGYFAVIPSRPATMTVGSTYEHHFTGLAPDEKGAAYLVEKIKNTFPDLSQQVRSISQWSGVRVSVPDKRPVTGSHPEKKGLFMMGALGSKGLLMSRYLAEILSENIVNSRPVDPEVSIERFL